MPVVENTFNKIKEQECIPVGCVPSAAVVVYWVGGCLPGGMFAQGVSAQRGVCLGEGDCGGRGCLKDSALLWTEFLRHACENITFRNYYCGR